MGLKFVNTNEWTRPKSNTGTKIFTASYPITCSVCERAIKTGSKFTYVPFGGKGATAAAHLDCACEAK